MTRPQPPDEPPYAGPPLTAQLVPKAGCGTEVRIEVVAPTGGYELVLDGVDDRDGVAVVRLTLTEPGEGEANVTALETKSVGAPLPPAARRVDVRVSTCTRGVQYVRQPPYLPAAALVR